MFLEGWVWVLLEDFRNNQSRHESPALFRQLISVHGPSRSGEISVTRRHCDVFVKQPLMEGVCLIQRIYFAVFIFVRGRVE